MKNKTSVYLLSAVLLVLVMTFSYTQGVADISLWKALSVLMSKLPFVGRLFDVSDVSQSHLTILVNLRLPRTLLAAASGMSLAVVGAIFQGIFRNPLAEPYVLGISSGSSLGATLAIVAGLSARFWVFSGPSTAAALGGLITVAVVMAASGKRPSTGRTLLTGIAISYFTSSLSTVLVVLSPDKIKTVTLWAMGSFSNSSWEKVISTIPLSILGLMVICLFLRDLNAISADEDQAKTLGVPVGAVKLALIATGTIMVGLSVAAAGIVGFVGLVVPNAVRKITGADFRRIIPVSAFWGAGFLVICDTLSRILFSPSEIPVGAVTALVGSPVFVYMLISGRERGR